MPLTWYECRPMPMAPPTRITLTLNVPNVSNLPYPHGKASVGVRRDMRHVASVTKSCDELCTSGTTMESEPATYAEQVGERVPRFGQQRGRVHPQPRGAL